ncbi:MAG: hypothetical protein CR981_01905 [Proteobacteria bacterium]|nr:MAG: hypothetical protein CR981_01905 [Pseudomonadota bacterium]
MILYDGTYGWDGKRHGKREPITRFPGSYHLKIFNLDIDSGSVTLLKPFLCVFSETGDGHSMLANPGRFATYVCEDFSLDMERVFWVELREGADEPFEVVFFSKSGKLRDEYFYSMKRRKPTAAERALIEQEMNKLPNG